MATLKRILRYVKGTISHGLTLSKSPHMSLIAHADWGGYPYTHHSTSGYCVFLGENINVCPPYRGLLLKLNIEVWLMQSRKLIGYAIYSSSFTSLFVLPRLLTVTMLVLFTCPAIQYNIKDQST